MMMETIRGVSLKNLFREKAIRSTFGEPRHRLPKTKRLALTWLGGVAMLHLTPVEKKAPPPRPVMGRSATVGRKDYE